MITDRVSDKEGKNASHYPVVRLSAASDEDFKLKLDLPISMLKLDAVQDNEHDKYDIKKEVLWRWMISNSQGDIGGTSVKNLPASAGDMRDVGCIPGLGKSPGGGHDNPVQYSGLENPMDRGAWWATVHGVTKRHN